MLPEHYGSYYKIIDNLFTPQQCKDLIALAETDAKWIQAVVNYGLGPKDNYVDPNYRNNQRILRFDTTTTTWLFEKLLPHIQDIEDLKPNQGFTPSIVGHNNKKQFKLVGLNERLSYLRYEPGTYFRIHCDGPLELPDGRCALITVQIYLGEDDIEGGSTRFWSSDRKSYYDVEPKLGRVLLFQQRNFWHSGEDVVKGTKYALRSDLMFLEV